MHWPAASPCPKLFERVVPRLSANAAVRLLHSAHVVDGIVKGLPADNWPSDSWQALRKLAADMVTTLQGPARRL